MRVGAVASATTAVLVLAACGQASDQVGPVTTAEARATATAPSAPDGMRLVGLDDVVVTVPEEWSATVDSCGEVRSRRLLPDRRAPG
jgi:uncharacterized lipoprotein